MTSSGPADSGRAYRRIVGAVLAFVLVSLVVKYAELLFTFEHRAFIAPQGTIRSRVLQVWLSLRFSWQELALGAGLLGLVAAAWAWRPRLGRAGRAVLAGYHVLLALVSLTCVFGVIYYSQYQTHFTRDDLEHLRWASHLTAATDLFDHLNFKVALWAWIIATPLVPLVTMRMRSLVTPGIVMMGAVVLAALSTGTWAAGRPNLAEAQLEASPVIWAVTGRRAQYFDLPTFAELVPTEPAQRVHVVTTRPKHVVLVVLESVGANAVSFYDPEAPGGRRLAAEYGDEITVVDQAFALAPNSTQSLFGVMTGRNAVPNTRLALARLEEPTLGEVFKSRGYDTQFLLNNPSDREIDALMARGFDRALTMKDRWEGQDRHARSPWGFDDRLVFEEGARLLTSRPPDAPPLFLVLYTNNAHHPYDASWLGIDAAAVDARTRHRLLVAHVLDGLTDFYAALKLAGVADDTLVLAYGDHGEAFGEHEGNFIHSRELYRENLHSAILLLHPRRLGLPPRLGSLVSLTDIFPTVLDIVGIDLPARDGLSMLFEAPRRSLFAMTDWGPGQVSFRTRDYLWVLSRTGRELLFDLRDDYDERRNILADRADVAAAFRARLGAGAATAGSH